MKLQLPLILVLASSFLLIRLVVGDDVVCTTFDSWDSSNSTMVTERDDFCTTNNCCNGGEYPCDDWPEDAKITICENACQGRGSCFQVATNTDTSSSDVEIHFGPNTCTTEFSGFRVGRYTGKSIYFDSYSCQESCSKMGELEGEQIYVGVGSCSSGTEACAEVGNSGATYITIW